MEGERWDIAVVGCGPAGLSAAVNAAVRGRKAVVFGGEFCSPKLQKSPVVNNYLGLPGISGENLRKKFLEHVRRLNIPVRRLKVDSVCRAGDGMFLVAAGDRSFQARAVVIATGVTVSRLIEGEREFTGKGVSYCATCDGLLFGGRDVAVIAHTPEGVEEANFLAGACRRVYFIPGAKTAVSGLKPEVEVVRGEVEAITGNGFVSGIRLRDRELAVDGVFIYRETFLPDRLVPGLALNGNHIKVDRSFNTNIKGIFAAGDCTGKPYQLAKAVGEGQVAALSAVQYLDRVE
ncbi:MAG: NAD(P)/FAD-dependent oxidoreductase [Pelotomaculum sp.]|nr:NAD(P)/FAD-dependent oxidoreductase [Pelotomaculum sp.]